MIVVPHRMRLGSVRKYVPTGKDLSYGAGENEHIHWQFASWIEDMFGPEGATPEEIYREFTGPKGLTAETTMELLRATVNDGYLRVGKGNEV